VADESAAQAAVQVALDAFGPLDVVVNNAGFGDIAPFEQLSAERFKAVIDTNFMASLTSRGRLYRTCASKGAAASSRYHRSATA
jgi:NAD(P)-dependent dehydrogenase (short-subunit alcohol dehydrogenase family)